MTRKKMDRKLISALVMVLVCAGQVSAQEEGAAPVRRLTNIINSYPCSSPDGTQVVFQSNRTGRYEIYVMNLDGSDVRQLTDRPGDNVTPSWSPDGSSLAFAANIGDNSDIYLMNADGSDVRRLTEHPGDDSHPHWSADGERIIFNSPRPTPDLSLGWLEQWHEVFSMKPDGSDLKQHTDGRTVITFPSFSPDGTKIVYRKITDTPGFNWSLGNIAINSEVFTAEADGSDEVNISNSAAFDGWPVWSPDGAKIAFASNRAGPANVGQIFVVNADGSDLRQVTFGPWSHVQPSWSPDGTTIFAYRLQETAEYEFGDIVALEYAKRGPE